MSATDGVLIPMQQPITGYHLDDEGHWVAQLACGHNQHVRHDPPWMHRPWVITAEGREQMLGFRLDCKKCDEGAPPDERPRRSAIHSIALPRPGSREEEAGA